MSLIRFFQIEILKTLPADNQEFKKMIIIWLKNPDSVKDFLLGQIKIKRMINLKNI